MIQDSVFGSLFFLPALRSTSRKKTRVLLSFTDGDNEFIEFENADHFSPWSTDVHNQVKKFLQKQGIVGKDYRQVTFDDFGGEEKYKQKQQVPWVRRKFLPLFV